MLRSVYIILFLLVGQVSLAQIWQEDFTGQDGLTTNPPAWTTDVTGANFGNKGYFQVVAGQMEAKATNGEVIWYGPIVDISAATNVAVSLLVSESGGMEVADYLRAYYILDGGSEILFGEVTDDIPGGGPISLSIGNISGTDLQIVIRANNDGNPEEWQFDDITISEPALIYSINSGNWSDTNNWSLTSEGSSCNCTPSSLTQVQIEGGDIINYDVTTGVIGLSISGSSQLVWNGGGSLTIDGVGSVIVDNTSTIQANGSANAVIIFSSGGNLINENSSTSIDLAAIEVDGSNTNFNMSGAGGLNLTGYMLVGGSVVTATNDLLGTLSINDFFAFPQNTLNGNLINNSSITITNDFIFNHQNCTLTNNGLIVIGDDIVVVSNSDDNNLVINNSGAQISLNELRLGNADGFVLNNSGTFSLTDDILGVVTNNQINNLSGGVLNYGGNNPDAQVALDASAINNLVNYNGPNTLDILIPVTSYDNLEISGIGTKSVSAPIEISGYLNVSSDLDMAGNEIRIGGSLTNTGNITTGANTIIFDGADQTINMWTSSFNHLVIAGTGTKFLNLDVTILGDLTITSTLSPVQSGGQVIIEGSFQNDGLLVNNNEIFRFSGSNTQSVGGSSVTDFANITVDKIGGQLIFNVSANLLGTMEVPTASTIDFDGPGSGVFTLVSNATNEARIGEVAGGSILTGNAVFQKYFAGIGAKYWRHIGSPVGGATVADLQNEIPISGTFAGNDNGTGSIPINAFPSLYYYDPSVGLPEPTETLDDRWVVYPATSNAEVLNTAGSEGRGYAVWIRDTNPFTWDLTGSINFGTIDFNLSGANEGWNLLANPFPSDIDWDNPGWSKLDIQGNAVYVWDGTNYRVWNGASGDLAGGLIAKGQGFWVQAASAAPQLIADETVKTASSATTYRLAPPEVPVVEITVTSGEYNDHAYIQFEHDAEATFEMHDAGKLQNSIFNLSSLSADSIELSINMTSPLGCEFVIPLNIENAWNGDYSFGYNINEAVASSYDIKLVDQFNASEFSLSNLETIQFSISDDAGSREPHRFYLKFIPLVLSPDMRLSATQSCEDELIAWLLLEETRLNAKYEIYVNDVLFETIVGTGSYTEIALNRELHSGANSIKVKAVGDGCLGGEQIDELAIELITTPEIKFNAETGFLMSSDMNEGLWYHDGSLLSATPSSFIEPNLLSGGVYQMVVSNNNCTRSSNEYLITEFTEPAFTSDIVVSPNPATEYINISVEGDIDQITITDIVGKVYYQQKRLVSEIPVSSFKPGIYFITLSKGGEDFTSRFVKQ